LLKSTNPIAIKCGALNLKHRILMGLKFVVGVLVASLR
jgi:hypothetical protein